MAWGYNSNNSHYTNYSSQQNPYRLYGQNPQLGGFSQSQKGQRQQNSQQAQQQQYVQQQQQYQQQQNYRQQQAIQQPYQQQPNQRQQYQQPMQPMQPQRQAQQPMQNMHPMQPQRQIQQPMQNMQPQRQAQQPMQNMQPMQPQQQQAQQPYSDPSVTYEPVSGDVLNLLKGKGSLPPASRPAEAPNTAMPQMPDMANTASALTSADIPINAGTPPPSGDSSAMGKAFKMGQILQNEKNSAAFYEHLAKLGKNNNNGQLADLFSQISERSAKRADCFKDMFRKYNGMEFASEEKPIFKTENLNEGIKFAIREESYSINEIADMYDYDLDDRFCKELNTVLYRKISDLGRLIGI